MTDVYTIVYIAVLVTLFVMGLTLMPAMAFFLRSGVPVALGEFLLFLHVVMVHLAWGGSALVQRAFGYELVPLRVDEGDIEVLLDGTWRDVDGSTPDIGSYAWGAFALLVERDDHLKTFEVSEPDLPRADGGDDWDGTLDEKRQTWRAFDAGAAPENTVSAGDGPKIDLSKVAEALRGANSERPAASGRSKALLEHGSVFTRGGFLVTSVLAILCLVLGAGTVWVAGL